MKRAKAIVAAIGGTLTALMVVLATVNVAAEDDIFDAGEIGSITTAVMTFALTVWAVWRVPNAGMVDKDEMLRTGTMPGRRV